MPPGGGGLPMNIVSLCVFLFGLRLYVPVNNLSVMLGRSHRFLGITSPFWEVNVAHEYCGQVTELRSLA